MICFNSRLVEDLEGQLFQLQESYEEDPYRAGSLAQFERIEQLQANGEISRSTTDELLKRHSANREELRAQVKSEPIARQYYPALGLPEDAALVVRTAALRAFEASLSGPESADKPLKKRERDTLLTIIAALAKEANVHLEKPSKAAGSIEGMTSRIGAQVSARTIENHLKKIPDALETRAKTAR